MNAFSLFFHPRTFNPEKGLLIANHRLLILIGKHYCDHKNSYSLAKAVGYDALWPKSCSNMNDHNHHMDFNVFNNLQ